jgi:hypothetical protein
MPIEMILAQAAGMDLVIKNFMLGCFANICYPLACIGSCYGLGGGLLELLGACGMGGIELVGQPFDNFLVGLGGYLCCPVGLVGNCYVSGADLLGLLGACGMGEIELVGQPFDNLLVGIGTSVASYICPCVTCATQVSGCYGLGGNLLELFGACSAM